MEMFNLIILGSAALLIYFFKDKKNRKDIYLAAIISFLWVYFSGIYGYRESNYVFLGINLFAFLAWTAGLVLVKKGYDYFKFKNNFILFSILYGASMIALEYVGYNLWGIKLSTDYPGIFGIEAMHMPTFAQIYYLTIGPVFVKLNEFLVKRRIMV